MIRNFSCSVDDGGSPPVQTRIIEIPADHTCSGQPREDAAREYVQMRGHLPAGNDILSEQTTADKARKKCARMPKCAGFTMHSRDPEGFGNVWYKSTPKS